MTRKQLTAEILTNVRKYDDLGLVDYRTINLTIKNELIKFGSNIMEPRQTFLYVQGGKVNLPEGFYKLKSLFKTNAKVSDTSAQIDDTWREDSYITRVVETDYEWDNTSQSHYKKAYKEIREERLIKGSRIYITHNLVEAVALVKGISKDYLANDCINKKVNNLYGSCVSINNSVLTTNFNEGTLFITYESLPEEDGELIIPDYPNLIDYLISKVTAKILESIWVNDESESVAQKTQYFNSKAQQLYISATTEVKFQNMSSNVDKKMRNKNSRDLRKYYY